jgi:hypothetical protein
MKDFLTDIVQHTLPTGIDVVKVTGDANETKIESVTEDRSVILNAKFNEVNPDFAGIFGMPNLSKLNTVLNIPEYANDATIELKRDDRNGAQTPVGIHFENAGGDFKNDYRFMTTEVINEKLKTVKFRGANFGITFEPSVGSIQRLKFQSQANSEEKMFVAKTEGTNLKFFFGDVSTHAGNFVFQSNVTGTLAKGWAWPVGLFISILNLQGDKTVEFSDDGVAKIIVNSGLITYEYLLPAKAK